MTERLKDWKLKDIDIWQEIDPLPVVQADHPSTDDEMLPVYRAIANAAVKKFIDYINRHSSDEAQAWGSPAYRKCIALPVWKKVEQEVGL